ncbi:MULTISPECIES: hypothetical protein [unclassified Mycobacteroides]|uniref:hypothetical protein n=1 Tax=unclassified Mycobacteroides TaxID=2618759 RepID=UPI0012FEEA6B|nr:MULTISPECIES: hypothetical protein [unclassified Mycobacteroides]
MTDATQRLPYAQIFEDLDAAALKPAHTNRSRLEQIRQRRTATLHAGQAASINSWNS